MNSPPHHDRTAASERKKGSHDKRTTMQEAVARHIRDGIHIGIGGIANTRIPVAVIHEIIRHGASDLTLSLQSGSFCAELLAGAMILDPGHLSIRRVDLAWNDREGAESAPLLGSLAEKGLVEIAEYTSAGMGARFKAAACGLPFFPIPDHDDAGIAAGNRGTTVQCPFSGDEVSLVRACRPDVGIVHAQTADMYGNARIFGTLSSCPEIAQAAPHTIMSVDQIIPHDNIRNYPNLIEIPHQVVDEVVEQPFGATPGACYGYYWFDMPHFQRFREICDAFRHTGNTDRLQDYYDRNIFGCETFEDFLNLTSSKTLQEIIRKDGSRPIILD